MVPREDPTTHAQAAPPAAEAPYQEVLAIAVELTWFLLGALGTTKPIDVVVDIIMAMADEATATSIPIPERQGAIAPSPAATGAAPVATVIATGAPPIPAAATTQDTSKTLADGIATVGYKLASAVRTAATLDRTILAADASGAARLLPVRDQVAAAIDHLGTASSRLTAMPSTGPSRSQVVVVHSPRDQAIPLPMSYKAVAEQPVVVATGRMVSAATVASSPATDHYRHASAHDAYGTWSP